MKNATKIHVLLLLAALTVAPVSGMECGDMEDMTSFNAINKALFERYFFSTENFHIVEPAQPLDLQYIEEFVNANPICVKQADEWGDSLLHIAASSNEVGVVKLLLEHGADVHAIDCDGETPLHVAIPTACDLSDPLLFSQAFRTRAMSTVEMLIMNGADLNKIGKKGTPLHRAVLSNYVKLAKLLIAHGANIGIKNRDGRTPLDEAMSSGRARHDLMVALFKPHQ